MARFLRSLPSILAWAVVVSLCSFSQAELISARELVGKRSAHTRVHEYVYREDASLLPTPEILEVTRTVVEKGTDINYLDESGVWQRVNTDITLSSKPGYFLEATRQRAKVRFAPLGGMNAEYEIGGRSIHLGIRSLAYFDRSTGARRVLANVQNVDPRYGSAPNRIIYPGAFPGADVEYVNDNTILKQNVVLKDPQRLPAPAGLGMDASSTFLVVVTQIDCGGSERTLWGDGVNLESVAAMEAKKFTFRDNNGLIVHYLATGKAWDSAAPHRQLTVFKRVVREEGGIFLLEGIPYTTLAEMTFPVTIDYVEKTQSAVGSEVWDRSKTWWVSDQYTLNDGDHLVIQPGAVVKIGSDYDGNNDECIIVEDGAEVQAVGDPYMPIFITSLADEGNGVDVTEEAPAVGGYLSAFYFNEATDNPSEIKNCRFRYASHALYLYGSTLTEPVRDNVFAQNGNAIFLECDGGDSKHSIPETGPSRLNATNNLIYDCDCGVFAHAFAVDGYGTFGLELYANTIDDCNDAAVAVQRTDAGICMDLVTTDNIIADCDYGFYDPDEAPESWTLDLDNNGFSSVGSGESDWFTGMFAQGFWGSIEETGTTFDQDNGNGSYYLDSTSDFLDAGEGTLNGYVLANRTTIAPHHIDVNAPISSTAAWEILNDGEVDPDGLDLGYHHPRVDYLVADNAGSGDKTVAVTAQLTVDPGVVVSFFRPSNTAYLPILQFSGANAKLLAEGTATDMILFDSAYYLGTNFFGSRTANNDDVNSIQFYGATSTNHQIAFCIFRHFNVAIYQWAPSGATSLWNNPIENNMFECNNSCCCLYYYTNPQNNPLTIRNNLFVDWTGYAYLLGNAANDAGYYYSSRIITPLQRQLWIVPAWRVHQARGTRS
ncbi:hypothetical protein HS125_15115 [bacterium]|nr:hypothetical protein [bacterium]